jgi:serine/threonine protein kinase
MACPRCRATYRTPRPRCPLDGARLRRGSADPLVGTWFAGHYLVEELVGQGGIGRVYRARHLRTKRPVALVVPPGERAADPAARSRFHREAQLARREAGSRAALTEVGESREGLPFLALSDADPATLADAIGRESPRDLVRTSSPGRSRRRTWALAAALVGAALLVISLVAAW